MVTWSVWAGSAAGTAHLRHSRDCDDAYATAHSAGALLLAVADGASGARFGAIGARMAVALAIREAGALLGARQPSQRGAACYWHEFLGGISGRLPHLFGGAAPGILTALGGQRINDLATTLCLAVIDHPWIAVCSFGDSFVVTRSGDGHLDLLSAERPDLPSDSTAFLSDPQASSHAARIVAWIHDLSGIALSTDGLDQAALEFSRGVPMRPFAGFFSPLFEQAGEHDRDDAKLIRFLASERLSGQTEDDKTLLLAVRTS